MGIQGLLPLLKSIHKPTHLRNFAGKTLGVDAYGWMHRGTVACAVELAEGLPTRKHIDFVMHRVRMLIHFGVKPYLVFDGDYLPSKAHTEKDRAARRKESKRVGLEMLRMGRPSQAQLELQKAVDVTPLMAREIIEELRKLDVEYVVAPYEADSQLAYLEKQGLIHGVLSEDSDLLVFGVNCLLTKLDQYGECIMINREDFTSVRDISLVGWSDKEFRMMAMLSGCDYLPGIDKMGLKTAYRLVRKHKTVDKIVRTVQFDGKMKVPKDYLESFHRAERTFMHQWVFCPETQRLVHLNALPAGLTAAKMPYIGKSVEPEHAYGVAIGELDPNTKKPLILPSTLDNPGHVRRSVSTPTEKHIGKPIDDYFKSRRTPLAELDPNSVTYSQSQQQLLGSQGMIPWSAHPVPVPQRDFPISAPRATQIPAPRVFGGPFTNNAQPPSSAPQVSRRTVSDPFALHRGSPKRRRLCSDAGIAAGMKGGSVETATSRFFAKAATQPSPSLRRTSKRRKTEEFDLWSDGSAAEALAVAAEDPNLAEAANATRPSSSRERKKLQVFAESADQSTISTPCHSTTSSISTTVHSRASFGTTASSFGSTQLQERSVFSKAIRVNFEALQYQSGSKSTKRTTPSRTSSAPFLTRTPLNQISVMGVRPKDDSPIDVDDSGIVLESPPGLPVSALHSNAAESGDNILDEAEWFAMEKEPAQFRQALSELPAKGSEDMLVPESPEEVSAGKGLNLTHFAFGA